MVSNIHFNKCLLFISFCLFLFEFSLFSFSACSFIVSNYLSFLSHCFASALLLTNNTRLTNFSSCDLKNTQLKRLIFIFLLHAVTNLRIKFICLEGKDFSFIRTHFPLPFIRFLSLLFVTMKYGQL